MIKYLTIFSLIVASIVAAKDCNRFTVAQDGSGDFKTITEAVEALPMFNYEQIEIFIKNGSYNEKLRIECDNVTLRGESRDSVIIKYWQLREDWIKNKDEIGPAVINIHADDIILDNMTIINTQEKIGSHAFTIFGKGTRTIITNCNVISKGGDTVSLWNFKEGMYYHANCYFQGGVDFVCPRGWCYVKDSEFHQVRNTATLWHAGSYKKSQKFVICNSLFTSDTTFSLGRHHYEAQFYLLNCEFPRNMIDKPIYRVTYKDSTRNRPYNWGDRYYYFNCKSNGENYDWFSDNLPENITEEQITAAWTFDNQWNPEDDSPLKFKDYNLSNSELKVIFDENVSACNNPELLVNNKYKYVYKEGTGSNVLTFSLLSAREIENIESLVLEETGRIQSIKATVNTRTLPRNIELIN